MILHLDFELASMLNIRDVGAYEWTKNPHTVLIMGSFAIDDEEPQTLLFNRIDAPVEDRLLRALDAGAEVHAWNAGFEYNVWRNIVVPQLGWPELPLDRFHCTMAAAACAGLPMGLDEAADAVNSPVPKDKVGAALMQRMAKPRRIDNHGNPIWWHVYDRETHAKLTPLFVAATRPRPTRWSATWSPITAPTCWPSGRFTGASRG